METLSIPQPCPPFVYKIRSHDECFGEDVRFLIRPTEFEFAANENGLYLRYSIQNTYESVYYSQGKFMQGAGTVWMINHDMCKPEFDTDREDVELAKGEGEKSLIEFKKKLIGLPQIDKVQLGLYLFGHADFIPSLKKL
jgi:hypothetical protein